MTLSSVSSGTRSISLGIHPYNDVPTLPSFVEGFNPLPAQAALWTPSDGLGFDSVQPITVSAFMAKGWQHIANSNANYYHNSPSSNLYDPNWVNLPTRGWTFSGQEQMTIEEYDTRLAYWATHHNVYPTLVVPETFYVVSSAVDNSGIPGGINALNGWSPFDEGFLYAYPSHRILTAEYFRIVPYDTATKGVNHPTYIDLLQGYSLDSRTIPSNPTITPSDDETITIGYYSENTLEPIPSLKSIYWVSKNLRVVGGQAITLPIANATLGTLYISSVAIGLDVRNLPTANAQYSYNHLFSDFLPDLFTHWRYLYLLNNVVPNDTFIYPETAVIRKLAANNDVWQNGGLTSNLDIGFDADHPMFTVDETRAYNWHIVPQANNSIGTLVMDSPRTIEAALRTEQIHTALSVPQYQQEIPAIIGTGTADDPEIPAQHRLDWYIVNGAQGGLLLMVEQIHKALDAARFAVNNIDASKPNKANLGYLVRAIARMLGHEVDDDGHWVTKDDTSKRRRTISANPSYKADEYSQVGFGSKGTVIKHLPNAEYTVGGWEQIPNYQQLLVAILEQLDKSLGLQQASNIIIPTDDKDRTIKYDNAHHMAVDVAIAIDEMRAMVRQMHVSSLVTQVQTSEILHGFGNPTATKFLEFYSPALKGNVKLPFTGVIGTETLQKDFLEVKANLGIILGQLL
jgi:hypothetical protein